MEQVDIVTRMSQQSFEEILSRITGGDINNATSKELLAAMLFKMDAVDTSIAALHDKHKLHSERVIKIEAQILEKQNEFSGAKFAMGMGWKIIIGIGVLLTFIGTIIGNSFLKSLSVFIN